MDRSRFMDENGHFTFVFLVEICFMYTALFTSANVIDFIVGALK